MSDLEPAKKPCCDAELLFKEYKAQMDAKHDRHERLVKLSRDVTIESKRIIFQLLTITGADNEAEKLKILTEAQDRIDKLKSSKFQLIIKELQDQDHWEYRRAFCLGQQEFIEALSLLTFLQHNQLLTHADVNQQLAPLLVSQFDYLLGICDLTGELMRLALGCGAKGDTATPRSVLHFLQELLSNCETVSVRGPEFFVKDFNNKLETMRQSVKKVERMCFEQAMSSCELRKLNIQCR